MKITNILLLCCLFALASPAATVNVITPTRTSLTNATLPQATGGYQLGATAIGVSGLTNLLLPGYVTLGNTTNRISDDGSNLTRNGVAIGTGGGGDTLWHDVANTATLTNTMESMTFGHDVTAGDDLDVNFDLYAVMNSATFNDFGDIYMVVSTNNAQLNVLTTANNTDSGVRLISGDSSASIRMELDGALTDGFLVASPSGYTGAGTLFLSDDGTYKAAGGGGDTIWTNISGTIQPLDGQTTNRLSFTSGAADNVTNAVMVVDTASLWSAGKLARFDNAGTNMSFINHVGGLNVGRDSANQWSDDQTLVGFSRIDLGEPGYQAITLGVSDNSTTYRYIDISVADAAASYILFDMAADNGNMLRFDPTVASTGSAVAYDMNTANTLASGDSLFRVRNAGAVGLNVTAAGAITGRLPVDYGFACSDETSALTTTTNAVRIQLPHAMTLTGVFASVTTAQTSGSIITVDLKEGGTSMLSTLVTIDNNETGSNTAATPAVISDTAIAQYGILVVSTTQVGTGGAGLKFWITGYR